MVLKMHYLNDKLAYYCVGNEAKKLNSLRACICVTDKCNSCCWYCSRGCYDQTNTRDLDPKLFDRIIDFIKFQEKDFIDLSFSGGEPTLNSNLRKYIEIAKERIPRVKIEILTNLLMPYEYYEELPPETKLWASYHTVSVKDEEKWFEKAKKLSPINVVLVATGDNLDEVARLYKKYSPYFLYRLDIHPITQLRHSSMFKKFNDINTVKYNDTIEFKYHKHRAKVFRKDGKDISENFVEIRNFKGMFCYGEATIMMDGNIYLCPYTTKPVYNVNSQLKKINFWVYCLYNYCCLSGDNLRLSLKEYSKMYKEGKI
jgi:organic radical activating enzyme